nr:hypothetical protein [Tanacetum cinerariifolium]
MATMIEQQVGLDEALVPSTQRLRIGISNFRLPSDIQSKESTLQVVYDVLRRCPFFKAVLVTADVPEIYLQEFWATTYVHQHSIKFKLDNKKHIVNLETFRDMLHICPRIHGQSFDELPFEEEILDFLRFLGHSAQIRTLTDVNVNKLFQPWRSFGAFINKCLTGKSSGFDSFMISQAQILWGLYHKRNIDHAFLIWEDFVYQVEHKNHKKSNEMYYPRFTKRSGTSRLIKNTMLVPLEKQHLSQRLVPERKMSGSDTSVTPPTAITTPTTTGAVIPRLTAAAKGKQPAKAKSPSDPSEVTRTEAQQLKIVLRRSRQETHISQLGGSCTDEGTEKRRDDDEGDKKDESDDGERDDNDERDDDDDDDEEEIAKTDEQDDAKRCGDDDEKNKSNKESDGDETREEKSFDPIPRTPEDSEDDGNGEEDQGLRISKEERQLKEEEADELYRDVDLNQGRGLQLSQDIEDSHVTLTLVHSDGQQESSSVSSQFMSNILNPTSDAGMESIFTTASSPMAPLQTPTPIMTPSTIATITTISHAQIPPTTIPSEVLQNLPTFDSVFRFEDRLTSLEAHFSKYIQTNLFAEAVSNILGIVHQYVNQQMKEARIIKEHVKSQVKEPVSKILPRIKQSMNAQLEAEVLTRSSHSSRTSYAVVTDLFEIELKKILIEKMEGNKSIQRSDEQRNLYKALVEAYEADKIILDTYGECGSKRQREGKELESASAPLEPASRSAGRSTTGSKSRQASACESAFAEEPVQTTSQIEEPSHPVFKTGTEDQPIVQSSQHPKWFSQPKKPLTPDRDWNKTLPAAQGSTQSWISDLAKQADSRSSFNELLDTPLDFSNFIMNQLRVDTLTREILAGPTYELMKGLCNSLTELEYHLEEPLPLIPNNRGRRVISFAHFINNDLEYLRGGAFSRKYTTSVTKTKAADYGNIKWIEDLFYGFAVNRESALDVYSKRRIIFVIDIKIVEWHNYKHLDWISVRHDDDKIYKFKEGDFKRLRLQDIKDMLLLLVQGKLSNLTVEECFAFNRLNLTKPDTYRSDLKRREAYTAYLNPRGFIYQNKDKKNRLIRIDELHKFSDGTLNDVHNALDDRLKGIRMQYLP